MSKVTLLTIEIFLNVIAAIPITVVAGFFCTYSAVISFLENSRGYTDSDQLYVALWYSCLCSTVCMFPPWVVVFIIPNLSFPGVNQKTNFSNMRGRLWLFCSTSGTITSAFSGVYYWQITANSMHAIRASVIVAILVPVGIGILHWSREFFRMINKVR